MFCKALVVNNWKTLEIAKQRAAQYKDHSWGQSPKMSIKLTSPRDTSKSPSSSYLTDITWLTSNISIASNRTSLLGPLRAQNTPKSSAGFLCHKHQGYTTPEKVMY